MSPELLLAIVSGVSAVAGALINRAFDLWRYRLSKGDQASATYINYLRKDFDELKARVAKLEGALERCQKDRLRLLLENARIRKGMSQG